jgi:disulfide bond formation protein DsbB
MINAGFVICFVVICFITNETNFFGIVGMGLMIVGTGSGTRKCFRALRFPRESALSAAICSGVLTLAGALTYFTVLTVTGRWGTMVAQIGVMERRGKQMRMVPWQFDSGSVCTKDN